MPNGGKSIIADTALTLLNGDLVTVAAADALFLVADGIAFAEQATQDWLDEQSPTIDVEFIDDGALGGAGNE